MRLISVALLCVGVDAMGWLRKSFLAPIANPPGPANCSLIWHTQTTDHFSYARTDPATFQQRIFLYDRYWKPNGTILFYTGNEGDVELYVNSTVRRPPNSGLSLYPQVGSLG